MEPFPCKDDEQIVREKDPPLTDAEVLILESDPLLRRSVRMCRMREDEGAVEYGVRLFLSGMHLDEAADLAKVSERRIRTYLKTDAGKTLAEEVRTELDAEFKALYGDAIENLRALMRDPKPEIKLGAVNATLRYLKDIKVTLEVGAEDLVQKIMRGGGDNGEA